MNKYEIADCVSVVARFPYLFGNCSCWRIPYMPSIRLESLFISLASGSKPYNGFQDLEIDFFNSGEFLEPFVFTK